VTHQRTAKEGELILIEEGDLDGRLLSHLPRSGDHCQLLVVVQIGRMDVLLSPLVTDVHALEQLAQARQAEVGQGWDDLSDPLKPPARALESKEQRTMVQQLLQGGGEQVQIAVDRGKKRACAPVPDAPAGRLSPPADSW
jgi:hypothetical protein